MTSILETQSARAKSREQGDLHQQYRPIGIGAVAAALAAAARPGESAPQTAANSNERMRGTDTLAA